MLTYNLRCLLAPRQGRVAERSIKYREASAGREDGVVFRLRTRRKTTPSASAEVATQHLLMTQPPLLAVMQGGEYCAPDNSLTSATRAYSSPSFPAECFPMEKQRFAGVLHGVIPAVPAGIKVSFVRVAGFGQHLIQFARP